MPREPEGPLTATAAEADPVTGGGLRVTCWGVRGSIPSPGRETAEVGGNTSCIEVRTASNRRIIFDAGSGLRLLGKRMSGEPAQTPIDLFLTHFHHDHIQGLPFFAPLFDSSSRIRIFAPRQPGKDVRSLVGDQMVGVYFPVPIAAVAAHLEFHELGLDPWSKGGLEVWPIGLRHPSVTYGYRVRGEGVSLAYLPDNELVGGSYLMNRPAWYADLVEFLRDVDVLFHDATYTDDEYALHEGWGHSTMRQAVELAEDAGVRRLFLHHHAPDRSDRKLWELLSELRSESSGGGSDLKIELATEGEEVEV